MIIKVGNWNINQSRFAKLLNHGLNNFCKDRMMREFNALEGYPEPKQPRIASKGLRTIHHRIIASYRGQDLYDGDRNYGYGAFVMMAVGCLLQKICVVNMS